MKKIGIRVDGNSLIGMGHVMRTLSIVEALKKQGAGICFYTASKETAAFICEKGFEAVSISGDYQNLISETEEFTMRAKKDSLGLILADTYYLTEEYVKAMRRILPFGYLDDTGEMDFDADFVINYNCYAKSLDYKKISDRNALWLGAEYVPLREEFRNVSFPVRDSVKDILITVGGSDPENLSGAIWRKLNEEFPEFHYYIICGRMNPHTEVLKKLSESRENLTILSDVKDMSEWMAGCDVAISAGGSTMYELCAVGIPVITFYYVENQRRIAEFFGEHTPIVNAGEYDGENGKANHSIIKEMKRLCSDADSRCAMSEYEKHLFDGYGAQRLAEKILEKI